MAQIHQINPNIRNKSKKRVGRGGKRGTFSGRGSKGQKARAGRKLRPQLRDIIKKIPKKRGYRFKSFREKPFVINLRDLEKTFKSGALVSPKTLLESGLVQKSGGRLPRVKILAGGELEKKLIFKNIEMSRNAKEKIGFKDASKTKRPEKKIKN